MKKAILGFVFAVLPVAAMAAGKVEVPFHMKADIEDKASMQRGLKNYVNYCMGCHSLEHSRFNRIARDLDIPEDIFEDNIIFSDKKIGSLMTISMRKEDSKKWFGAAPPDLTLINRVRGTDWIYSYLKSFYLDPARPYGVNNKVFKDVGMPHVLAHLQGDQTLGKGPVAVGYDPLSGTELTEEKDNQLTAVGNGQLSEKEYDKFVKDLVNFLVYVAEPYKLESRRIGMWVLLFLALFFVPVYLLNKEYWKDVK